jgi:hypothetical protein
MKYFQMSEKDAILLEVNANFSLKIYFINPGDEIFAPFNIWPISPQEKKLSKMNEYTEIRLTKQSKVTNKKKDDCNPSPDYVYGGIKINISALFIKFP